jgi:hypothetical protein
VAADAFRVGSEAAAAVKPAAVAPLKNDRLSISNPPLFKK